MKTTVDITDALFDEARRAAAEESTTLRALIERGLRLVLGGRRSPKAFRLRKASVRGRGLQKGVAGAGWPKIRDLAYGERGA